MDATCKTTILLEGAYISNIFHTIEPRKVLYSCDITQLQEINPGQMR